MVTISVMALANDFVLEHTQPLTVRLEIAKGFLKAAVDYVNAPSDELRDDIIQKVIDTGEDDFGMVMPDRVFDSYVVMITKMIRSAGWDKRLVIKLDFKDVSIGYLTAKLVMDLEATAEKLGWDTDPAEAGDKESVMEVITDNPSMEELNEFNRLSNKRPQPRKPLLSDRGGKFIQDDPRRSQR